MKMKNKYSHPAVFSMDSSLMSLPLPLSISFMWNWGSMLGLILMIQIITGLILSSHFNPSTLMAFSSTSHISREVDYGWTVRFIHMNSASMFFFLIYIHISRGILFSSFSLSHTWYSGMSILLILMATAFLGYVLPWGQMSFWGATVITNLLSAIPYIGSLLVQWLWGGFSVGNATLNRFFALHFILPFILTMMVITHLWSLHVSGSNNPQGTNPNTDKIKFNPFFSTKDSISSIILIFSTFMLMSLIPSEMGDPENYNMANPLNTPIHIQPEWYFLFAYAILRSIPNKLGGVIGLLMSILIIATFPMKNSTTMNSKYSFNKKLIFFLLMISFILLTWLGANPVENPFEKASQMMGILYFMSATQMCLK